MSTVPDRKIRETLGNPGLQLAVYSATGRLMAKRANVVAPDVLPDYQELRDQAHALKKHTLDNLDYYLEQFEAQVTARGGKVIWCKDGAEVVLCTKAGIMEAGDASIAWPILKRHSLP